jgi:hypothetical protein
MAYYGMLWHIMYRCVLYRAVFYIFCNYFLFIITKVMFRVSRGVDLNIALRGTFEYCSNVPHVISMILIFILEKLVELITTLGQRNVSHVLKEEQ